jgi:hypothetical protein
MGLFLVLAEYTCQPKHGYNIQEYPGLARLGDRTRTVGARDDTQNYILTWGSAVDYDLFHVAPLWDGIDAVGTRENPFGTRIEYIIQRGHPK